MKKNISEKVPIGTSWGRIIIIMKLTTLFIFLGLVSSYASSFSQSVKLNLKLNDVTIIQILDQIEDQSEFIFIYKNEVFKDPNKKVTIFPEKINKNEWVPIEKVLDELFKDFSIKYKVIQEQIILTPDRSVPQKTIEKLDVDSGTEQSNKTIRGSVKDKAGNPIPGATVIVKGTTTGVVTDFEGNYTLKVPENAILIFSFVGMERREIEVRNQEIINAILEEGSVGIEEVVAVGYGIQKKQSVVGSISQVESEALRQAGNVTDLKQALTGQIPGIATITSSGEPGGTRRGESATDIYIRGQTTWNGGQPLILVDGIEREMHNIEVSEVESISVLKDASATAVFGVKGANGVILITTKRGSVGKAKFSVSYMTTAQMLSKLPDKMDSYSALLVKNEAIEREVSINETTWNDYTPYNIVTRYRLPQSGEYAVIYPNVDWADAMFKDIGFSHKATINSQGGTRFVSYFASLSYLHEGDMFKDYNNNKGYDPNYNFNRFNFRSNLDFNITKTTKLSLNLSGYYAQKNTNWSRESSGVDEGVMWSAITYMAPDLYLPQYEDGRWGYSAIVDRENPIAVIYNMGIRETYITELNSDIKLEQKLDFITKGLSAKVSVAFDSNMQSEGGLYDVANSTVNRADCNTPLKIIIADRYEGPDQDPSEYTENVPTAGSQQFDWMVRPWNLVEEDFGATNWSSYIPLTRRSVYELQMNYARTFDLHSVSATGVFKREQFARGSMFPKYREDWVFRSTYDYNSRYLFEVNGAYNGSEQFGPGYRFDFFPSLAAGWYVSNEKFFKVNWVDRLKLRYSIGWVGDDNISGDRWLYASQYEHGGQTKLGDISSDSSPYVWYSESVVGNPDIRWEKALKTNYGIELGILKNMFSLNYDFFTENRTDVLLAGSSRTVAPYFGATPPSANLGQVQSHGHEIEVRFQKAINNNFRVWANFAFAHNENEIIKAENPELMYAHSKDEGYPIGQSRSLVTGGFMNSWDDVYASTSVGTSGDSEKLPGSYYLLDFNGDGEIKESDDAIPLGYSNVPQNTYNYSFGANYKDWSFMVQFYAVNNVTQYYPLHNFYDYTTVVYGHVSDYWSADNQNASSFLPRWRTQSSVGDYYYYDGSYIRLKTAEIAYSMNKGWVKNLGLSSLRVFLNGNNLLFWSKLPSDRESSSSGGSANQGSYPTTKRVNMGIELNF